MSVVKPFDFFKEETSDTADTIVRTDAMAKVALIAALMGPESARRDLIPYLVTKAKDMDQVQLQMAVKMEHLLPYIGGLDHLTSLIPLIELLFGAEETAVRSAICLSVNHILDKILDSSDKISSEFLDMTSRLLKDEDEEMFYSRVSLCAISGNLYRILANKDRPVFFELFNSLLKHDSMMVRSEAATAIAKIILYCDKAILTTEGWDSYSLALNDVNLSIRTIAIENMTSFCTLVKDTIGSDSFLTEKILPLITTSATESAWNIRRAVTKNMSEYLKVFLFDKEKTLSVLDSYLKLLLDKESEVRLQALEEISSSSSVLINAFGIEVFTERILPVIERLLDDPINAVRKVLAEQSIRIATDIKPEVLINLMFKFISALSKDIDPLVKLRIVRNISSIADKAKDHFLNLTDTLTSFYKDDNWRVRMEACFATPLIYKHMGVAYFRDNILQLYIGLLKDDFDEVRTSCAKSIGTLMAATEHGNSWIGSDLLPLLKTMAASSYFGRISMLNVLEAIMTNGLPDHVFREALSIAVGAANDNTPNVRLRAAQLLGKVGAKGVEEDVLVSIQTALSQLQTDKDRDVKFYSAEAVALLRQ